MFLQELETSKAKLQKEFNQNEVSVQTLQVGTAYVLTILLQSYLFISCWQLASCRVLLRSSKGVSALWRPS